MVTNVSLRRLLRRIPDFRSLPGKRLDEVMERIIHKDYKPGDVLWHTRDPIDFFGVIQSGEIAVEHRLHGRIIRVVKLTPGDYVQPRELKRTNRHLFVLARAATNVRLAVLDRRELKLLQSKWSDAADPHYTHHMYWPRLWAGIVAILIVFLSRNDVTRIISGILYMASIREDQPASHPQKSLQLLEYAESVDPSAVFAYNQEGYILFQHTDLERATSAFANASTIEQTNSTSLNNLGVIYHITDRIPEATNFLQKAAASDPNNAIVRYNLGVLLMNQNYKTEALREFKEASRINPTWDLPYIQQGFIFIEIGDDLNAEQIARTAIRLDSNQQSAHLILAIALYDEGKNQEALEAVEDSLHIAPNDHISSFYKALILSRMGEFEPALITLQQLLEVSNDPQDVSRISAEIESIRRSLQNFSASAR